IESGDIDSILILDDDNFDNTVSLFVDDDPSLVRATFHGDWIFLRQSSQTKLSDLVHEGSHMVDQGVFSDSDDAKLSDRVEEERAWRREEEFRESKGWEPLFDSEGERIEYLRKAYPEYYK